MALVGTRKEGRRIKKSQFSWAPGCVEIEDAIVFLSSCFFSPPSSAAASSVRVRIQLAHVPRPAAVWLLHLFAIAQRLANEVMTSMTTWASSPLHNSRSRYLVELHRQSRGPFLNSLPYPHLINPDDWHFSSDFFRLSWPLQQPPQVFRLCTKEEEEEKKILVSLIHPPPPHSFSSPEKQKQYNDIYV